MAQAVVDFTGQGWLQVGELLLAFVLSALIGLERQLRRHSAGIRTQAIVGTSAALFVLVSKYGFMDVLGEHVQLDPSRVAAQVVTGIGFLGAGLILTRHGAVRGLTTAASVWETAAIGMAAGAGLWLLALVVTALHFVITFGVQIFGRHLPGNVDRQVQVRVVYVDGRGLLRAVLSTVTGSGWAVQRAEQRDDPAGGTVSVTLELEGSQDPQRVVAALTDIDGVRDVQLYRENELE
ncbi:MgtC/SapB family protein [Microbacterium horticulturae]|uniref:MgtC/SapB family protein n=1 Tax=Microbacterium horticulturae TaxID=3028316 RepID=A0ABY8BZA9_9MICO|nr:MgtC/SapB family protein [Microbacterium sp. KACC 23027]WEG09275.1 MgtC/SapB family protein [Microbacterium sp. KACC 23027]